MNRVSVDSARKALYYWMLRLYWRGTRLPYAATMDALFQDLRTAIRSLRATPWFTLAVAATLAIAIGANTLLFSVVNGVLLNPLEFRAPNDLVGVVQPGQPSPSISVPDFMDWRAQIHGIGAFAAYDGGTFNMTGLAEPVRLQAAVVSANWFSILGVSVERGRAFAPDEDRPQAPHVAILSDALWRSRFGANPAAIGRAIDLDGTPYTVIGVAPPRFSFPKNPDIWVPDAFPQWALSSEARGSHFLKAIGRLSPGTTFSAAAQEFGAVTERIRQQYLALDNFRYAVEPLREQIVGDSRPALLVLLGAVGCVLLIACADVANLMLIRATSRASEIGVRLALGAGGHRIVRQLVFESVLLALVGAAGGIVLATGGIHLLIAGHPGDLPRLDEVSLSVRVLLFTLMLATGTGVLFGLVPAIHAANPDLVSALKSGMRGASAVKRTNRLRAGLVVSETALAVLLLIGAGLLSRSFLRLVAIDPGFVPQQVVRFSVTLPEQQYQTWARVRAFTHPVLETLRTLPGTMAASTGFGVPFGDSHASALFHIDGRPPDLPGHQTAAVIAMVTPRFFAAMGIPVRRGRVFTDDDRPGGHQVLVINEAMATRYFPGQEALGQRIDVVGWSDDSTGHSPVALHGEIVGIVGNTKDGDLLATAFPTVYAPFDQMSQRALTFVVRTTADPSTMLRAARRAVAAADPGVPIFHAGTLDDALRASDSLSRPRLYAAVVGAFALVSLALAVIGIYGVLAFSVRERQRELGIRVALGAREAQVVTMVVAQGVRLAVAGLSVGFAIALIGGRVLASLLYGISPSDPPTYGAVSVGLIAVAALASWLPARRAAVVDPVIAMRTE
jgi:putative ABC transport system permease protein